MDDMRDLYVAVEAFDTSANLFAVETAAIEAIDAHGYSPALDRVFMRLGLESSTVLYDGVFASEEGIVDWVKEKVGALTSKAQALANKIYGKITGRSDEVKDLLAKLENGEDVKLPVSKGAALAGVGVILAATAAITYLTASLAGKKLTARKVAADSKGEAPAIAEKEAANPADKQEGAKPASAMDKARELAAKGKARLKSAFGKKELPMSEAEAETAKAQAQVVAAEEKAKKEAKGEGESVDTGFIRSFGKRIMDALSSLKAAITKFFAEVASKARETGDADSKGVMARVRFCARYIATVARIAWAGISSGAGRAWGYISGVAKRAKDKVTGGKDDKGAVPKPEEGEKKPAQEGFGRL